MILIVSCHFIVITLYITYLKRKEGEREEEGKKEKLIERMREKLRLLIHSPNVYNGQSWVWAGAEAETGTQSRFLPCGWQEANCLSHHVLLASVYTGGKLDQQLKLGTEPATKMWDTGLLVSVLTDRIVTPSCLLKLRDLCPSITYLRVIVIGALSRATGHTVAGALFLVPLIYCYATNSA